MSEKFTFDKFVDDILIREEKSKKRNTQNQETIQRKYVQKYTERSNNRIRVGVKK